jgi:hypothetical protein
VAPQEKDDEARRITLVFLIFWKNETSFLENGKLSWRHSMFRCLRSGDSIGGVEGIAVLVLPALGVVSR